MDDENIGTMEQWFDSTFIVLNESYQLDLRRVLSPDTCELIHALSDYYMFDNIGLFMHLLALTSYYLTPTSFVYADNQLKHKLNLHLLLVVRSGYERSSLVEHIKQAMNNVQCLRQTGQQYDTRHTFNSNIFCRSDESTLPTGFCISDKFDEHGTYAHIQKQNSHSIIGTSNGQFIRKILETKFNNNTSLNNNNNYLINNTDWLMIFIASKARLFCRRPKLSDSNRYPSLEQWIIVLNCHCSNLIDFYFDDPQANQFMCDYLDALYLKATSLEDTHSGMSARYLSAREQVLRVSASLRVIELAIETLIVYRRTFHTFGQADKVFFDNCNHIIEKTRSTTTVRVNINVAIVQSAIYFVNTSIKQFEIMFEPTLNTGTLNPEVPTLINQAPIADRSWILHQPSTSSFPPRSTSPASKRLKTFVDPSYVKSLELAHELLLLPYVAFTRTSVYANSKLKRNAAYLDSVIEELKKYRLLIMVRQGVQMVDGTRRRVDLLVKCAPMLKEDENNNNNNNNNNEKNDDDLIERLGRFGVEYDRYIQTLGTLDIGDKYRLSEQCFDLLNSPDYKRYLTVDLERIAPLHRIQQQQQHQQYSQQEQHQHSIQHEETNDLWATASSSSNIKLEPADFYA
ncbi:unnamed protein product [Adineta steineri]|uniref:Uncharacterized protein n=1 Tax=Adineta steineri TaxID=433720 RepID=A0A814SRP5_9BILA|nr:unnamed protein product [Adineta steineri]CAF1455322.1 unnamed protein product [Adineta steineri]